MAFTLDEQELLELEAQAQAEAEFEFEKERRRKEEDLLKQKNSFLGIDLTTTGPDFNESKPKQVLSGILEAPKNYIKFGVDVGDTIGDAINGQYPDPLRTAETVGQTGSMVAGGLMGGAAGSALGPVGALIGGAAGAALGPEAFKSLTDAATERTANALDSLPDWMGHDYVKGLVENLRKSNPKTKEERQQMAIASQLPTNTPTNVLNSYGLGLNQTEDDNKQKEFLYNLGQNLAFGVAPKLSPENVLKSKLNPFSEASTKTKVVKQLETLDPEYRKKIDAAMQSPEYQSDPLMQNRSLGELVNSDVLKNAERVLNQGGADFYGRAKAKEVARNDAQLRYLDELVPKTDLDSAGVQETIQSQSRETIQAALDDANKAQKLASTVNETLPNKPIDSDLKIEDANQVRSKAEIEYEAFKRQVSNKFEQVGEAPVNLSGVQKEAQGTISQYIKDVGGNGPNVHPLLQQIIDYLHPKIQVALGVNGEPLIGADGLPAIKELPITAKDAGFVYSEIRRIIKQLPDQRSRAIANNIATAVDTAVKNQIPKENYQSWKEGRDLRIQQDKLFESKNSPTATILAKDLRSGEPSVIPSRVVSKYWRSNNQGGLEAAKNYKDIIAKGVDLNNKAEANAPLYREALESFRQAAYDGEKVKVPQARRWIENHSDALSQFPELKETLSNIEKANSLMNEKFGTYERTKAEIENSALKNWLQVENPEIAVRKMIRGPGAVSRTRATYQFLKNPEARAGLQRAVVDEIIGTSFVPSEIGGIEGALQAGIPFEGNVLPGKFLADTKNLIPVLKEAGFTEKQIKGFEQLYKDKFSQVSVGRAKTGVGSDTAQNATTLKELIGVAIPSEIKTIMYRNIKLPPSMAAMLGVFHKVLSGMPKQKYLTKLHEALLDPRMAKDLDAKPTAQNMTRAITSVFREELLKAGVITNANINAQQGNGQKGPLPSKTVPITTKKTFPKPDELLPETRTSQKKNVSLNLQDLVKSQPKVIQAIVRTESGNEKNPYGNPYAISRAGATGLAQIMPANFNALGITDPFDPKQSLSGANKLYEEELGRYKNQDLAIMAYNLGSPKLNRAIKLAGTRDPEIVKRYVPKETKDYHDRINAILSQV